MATWEERMAARARVRRDTTAALAAAWHHIADATRPVGTTRPVDPGDPWERWGRPGICSECYPGTAPDPDRLVWNGHWWTTSLDGRELRWKPSRLEDTDDVTEGRAYLDLPHAGGTDRELRCQCLCHHPIALAFA